MGQLDGPRVAPFVAGPDNTPAQAAFGNQLSRGFTIPARLVPPAVVCFAFQSDATAACLRPPRPVVPDRPVGVSSYVGSHPPIGFLLPGLAVRLASDAFQAVYLGRLASAVGCMLLLGAAARVLAPAGPAALMGLALATTPMVVFLASELAGSGMEVAAAIAFAASLIALGHDDGRRPSTLATFAASGVVLALARPLGPVYVAALGLVALPLLWRRRWWSRGLALATTAVAAAALLGVAWAVTHQPARAINPAAVLAGAQHLSAIGPEPEMELVGVFGWTDTVLPVPLYVLWGALVALVAGAALLLAGWRARLAIVLGVATAVVLSATVAGVVLNPAFELQGRYALPVVVAVPLLAGRALGPARRGVRWIAGLLAATLFLSFWANEQRYAVGTDGPFLFFATAGWAPPAGWLPWFLLAGLGAILVAVSFTPAPHPRTGAVSFTASVR
jgi:hypothetical protein